MGCGWVWPRPQQRGRSPLSAAHRAHNATKSDQASIEESQENDPFEEDNSVRHATDTIRLAYNSLVDDVDIGIDVDVDIDVNVYVCPWLLEASLSCASRAWRATQSRHRGLGLASRHLDV